MSEAPAYICPDCQQAVPIGGHTQQGFIKCPHCGAEFVLADDPATTQNSDADSTGMTEGSDELDGLRIRQLSQMRRAAYRGRSYAIIAAAACLVAAAEAGLLSIQTALTRGWSIILLSFLVLAFGAVYGAFYFGARAIEIHEETKPPAAAPDPQNPPDFSQLGDGSDAARKLHEIRDE